MKFNQSIFREYDIRGIVGVDFDADLALRLGFAYAQMLKEALPNEQNLTVAVGHDCRLSANEMRSALTKGLLLSGIKVIDSGMGPTPQLYYTVVSKKLSGGIQVTASHNPGDQNGFKMMLAGKTLSGPDIQKLKDYILKNDNIVNDAQPALTTEYFNAHDAYLEELIKLAKPQIGKRKIKVVVDGGNGVGGMVGPQLLRALGCEVIELFTDPDGTFPNHHPDPTVLENIVELRARVVSENADLGIAWDGDADRIGVVDEKGNPIYGDMLLVLYGRQLLKEVKNPIIIGDVKCSDLMFNDLKSKGANTVMSKTGHSLIKAKLKELHGDLAGEMSGHMFFVHRYFGYDDAIHASARIIEIITNTDSKLSELLADLPKMYSTPEIRVDCPEEIKFKVAEGAKKAFSEYQVNTLDGVRVTFPDGWGLVRASNTQPALVMRFEASSPENLVKYQKLVEERIDKLKNA
ncbi:MAG: phosphomannomutase/phosphoglucomutase [Proteobacteria bacterium]|nr:phosphomannomutase/phosphoglucomutase [Pseudomonadota bacterium]